MAVTLVRHAQNFASSATTCTVTLGGATTAGHCLIVMAGIITGTSTISGITLGGTAGNFAQDVTVTNTAAGVQPITAAGWSDPNCAGGQTSVVVTFGGSTFAGVDVYEVSGLATSSVLDQKSANQSGSTSGASFDSLATSATAADAEFWAGVCAAVSATSGNSTFTGPSAPWANEAQTNLGSLSGVISGYQITSSAGTADYSGTITPNSWYAAAVVTYKPAGARSGGLLVASFP